MNVILDVMKDYDSAFKVVDSMSEIFEDEEILARVDILIELGDFEKLGKPRILD